MTVHQETWAESEPDLCRSVFQATVADSRGVQLWSQDDSEEIAAKRAFGFIAFLLLPEPGLDEAIDELREVWQFHSERAALGPPESFHAEIGQGRIVESVERPLLAIED
jgi:hypothetical protein